MAILLDLMATLGDCVDIDNQIVAYLDPPQILTMSEVNKYFNVLVKEMRDQFTKVKYNKGKPLKFSYEWIIQWHMKKMSNTIKEQIKMGYGYWKTKQMFFSESIDECFYFNNRTLIPFLFNMIRDDHVNENKMLDILSSNMMYIFGNEFDMEYVTYVDNCLQSILSTSLKELGEMIEMNSDSRAEHARIVIHLIDNKKYDGVLYFIRLFEKERKFIRILKYEFTEYIENKDCKLNLRECPPDFLKVFFKILKKSDKDIDSYYLTQACLADNSELFFKMVLDRKYYKCVNHNKLLSLACQSGHISIVKWIIADAKKQRTKVEFNDLTYFDNNLALTPLENACYYGNIKMVKWLIKMKDYKPDIHLREESPFFLACLRGHINVAKYLIKSGETKKKVGRVDIHAICARTYPNSIIRKTIYKYPEIAEWLFELSTKSYGKFDLRREILKLRNDLSNPDDFNEDKLAKMQIIHDRMCELTTKHYGGLDMETYIPSESSSDEGFDYDDDVISDSAYEDISGEISDDSG